jgi:hypothetical protein
MGAKRQPRAGLRPVVVACASLAVLATAPARAAGIEPVDVSHVSSTPTSASSWTHVTSDVANRYLLVGITLWQLPPATPAVASLTYGGVPLTRLGAATSAASVRVEIWGLAAPAVGAATVNVTLTEPGVLVAGAVSLRGVQPDGAGPVQSALGDRSPGTLTLPSEAGGYVFAVIGADNKSGLVSAGQSELWNVDVQIAGAAGGAPGAPAVTVSWSTGSDVRPWIMAAVSLAPAPDLNGGVPDGGAADGAGGGDGPESPGGDDGAPPGGDDAPPPGGDDGAAPPEDVARPGADGARADAPGPADGGVMDAAGGALGDAGSGGATDGGPARSTVRFRIGCDCSIAARAASPPAMLAAVPLALAIRRRRRPPRGRTGHSR